MSFTAFQSKIDVNSSKRTVDHDPFLDPFAKDRVNGLLDASDTKKKGLISQHDLASTALKTGAGVATAYTAGKVVGGILGLPEKQRDNFSKLGALAGAVWNSGLVDKT